MSGTATLAGTGVAVTLERVEARYGERRAVGPITARLEGPGLYWVTGRNGAGKSTLLRLLAGLRRPSRGALAWSLDGQALDRAALRREAKLAAPGIELYEELSLEENLRFLARLEGVTRPAAAAAAALTEVGLAERAGERPGALSSGLRQRVRLAAAWLAEPVLLLLDEPAANLDAPGREWLWRRVRTRCRQALCVVATNRAEEPGAGEPRLDLDRWVR